MSAPILAMTVPLGSLGAEIEAGGKTGLERGAESRPGGNPSAGSSQVTPSFQSSWQAVINASRGVSRGTNGAEGEEEQTGKTTELNGGEEDLTPKNIQVPPLVARSLNAPATIVGTSQSGAIEQAAAQAESRFEISRSRQMLPMPMQDDLAVTAPGPNIASSATEHSSVNHRDRADGARHHRAAHAASTGTLAASSAILAPVPLPAIPSVESGLSSRPLSAPRAASQLSSEASLTAISTPSPQGPASAQSADAGPRASTTAPLRGMTQGRGTSAASESSYSDLSASGASLRAADPGDAGGPLSAVPHLSSAARMETAGENPSQDSAPAQKLNTGAAESIHSAPTPDADPSGAIASGTAQAGAATAENASKEALEHPSPERPSPRTQAHEAGREAVPGSTVAVAVQPVPVDAAAAVRSPGIEHAPANHGQTITASAPATSAQDAFSALDRGSSLGAPAWTHASGQHAEAGFHDPDLGWVGVRADLNAGDIHATLVPDSANAAQALSGHLAGLGSHLAEQHAPVVSLSMGSPAGGAEGSLGQRMGQGTGGDAQGSRSGQSQSGSQGSVSFEPNVTTLAATAVNEVQETAAYPGGLRGTRISVMA